MSDAMTSFGLHVHKYKVGDTFDFDGIVEIISLRDEVGVNNSPMYEMKMQNGRIQYLTEDWIDAGIDHFNLDEHGRKQDAEYAVPHIASAPEDLKVGDRVEIAHVDCVSVRHEGEKGTVTLINQDGTFKVGFAGYSDDYPRAYLIKIPDTISFEEDSDNVKAFKAILNEMVETYKAKDADYGSAYDDGYRLFGHTQLLSRIYEKFSRVKHLLDGHKPNVAENIYDTLTDMAVQAICLRMLLQKNDFENVD